MISRSRHHSTRVVVLAALALGLAGSPARGGQTAADQIRLVVLGGSSARTADQVGSTARAVLVKQGLGIADAPPVTPALAGALRSCYGTSAPDACKQAAAGRAGAQHLLAIDLGDGAQPASTAASVTAWLVDDRGKVVVAERRYCSSPCTAGGLAATTRDLVRFIVRESLGTAIHSVIRIHSMPPGARISVDGQPVGVSDLDYTVYPGRHQVTIDKAGYRLETREVSAPRGATVTVDVALEKRATARRSGAWPWLLGGVGVAAIAGGVTLIALDSPKTGAGGQEPSFRRSFWPGVALAAAGAGLVGGGVWLLLRHRGGSGRDARDRARSPAVGMNVYGGRVWVFGSAHF